jgi:Domain of unknown function (DUF5615)
MIQYLLDEHVHPAIALGLWQRDPNLNIVQAHLSLAGQSDSELLAWGAEHGYIVVTADRNTLINDAYKRMSEGLETEGVFLLRHGVSFGDIIESLYEISQASEMTEWANRITFIPLR